MLCVYDLSVSLKMPHSQIKKIPITFFFSFPKTESKEKKNEKIIIIIFRAKDMKRQKIKYELINVMNETNS